MAKKNRLDAVLVNQGLAADRSFAQRLVMAGQVFVNGQVQYAPAALVSPDDEISLQAGRQFVSRGGEKLAAALAAFDVVVKDQICADVGASTGGFTDCLLQHGAAKIYAIDVGQGILSWQLRKDERVIVMEGSNARHISALPERPGLITVDASFISLQVLLPVLSAWLHDPGDVLALIKPQFEVGREQAARDRGVIRSPELHRQVLQDVLGYASKAGYHLRGLIASPLLGPKGNREFLAHWHYPGDPDQHFEPWIEAAMR